MQPKKQLKIQYIGIFEEIDSFYWPKMHFLKEGQKIRAWVDPPPLIRAMPERKRFFQLISSLRWAIYLTSLTKATPLNVKLELPDLIPIFLGQGDDEMSSDWSNLRNISPFDELIVVEEGGEKTKIEKSRRG